MPEHYSLTLTKYEYRTIASVGHRYCWSAELLKHVEPGENKLSEKQAWSLRTAFNNDTHGRHGMFPMLSPGSYLMTKLLEFYSNII